MLRSMPIAPMGVRQSAFRMPRELLAICSWRLPDLCIHRTRLSSRKFIQADATLRRGAARPNQQLSSDE